MDSRTSIKIPINKLNLAFIKDMQEKYGDAELEIIINQQPNFRSLQDNLCISLIRQ